MLSTGRRHNSLSLSGGHIVSDQLTLPSYSPNAVSASLQPFPWDESVDDINTPDIDPSFFDNDPFKKYNTQNSLQMDIDADTLTTLASDDCVPQLNHPSLEDNLDLSSLINQSVDSHQQIVSPNDVLENQYIPSTTAPVLHYLQPRPVQSIASTVNLEIIANTSLLDCQTSDSLAQFSSPSHSTFTYLSPSPSPALSQTSSTSHTTLVSSVDAFSSDTNATIDSKPEPEPTFLQPTVINDHLYTLPSKTSSKRKSSDTTEKSSNRQKNNMASKKSRVSKKDKQKQMDEQIQHFIADNARCKQEIERMEKEIQWCKDYLFRKVVSSAAR